MKRNRLKSDYNTHDIYLGYCKLVKNPLTEKEFNKFWDILGDKIFERIVYHAETMILPGKYKICIREVRSRGIGKDGEFFVAKRIDWKATKEYHLQNPDKRKTVIYHTNPHNNGRKYMYIVERSNIVRNMHVYKLKLTRKHIRALPKAVKENNVEFYKYY